ncbi:chemotaxis protein CheW [Methyloversatilis thermotolerans]|uniref:chemotaxis protein CheW n=1 Tax=Methyloversatilis thermotolerans TaxID=1346290 RepID=UPI0003A39CF1|nr:chemotaxis protein CheW [Methyloversatilis thermotolerans]
MTGTETLLPHMRGVLACERELAELRLTWRLIETTAKMVCPAEAKTILPAMASTREAFGQLESDLVRALAAENVRKVALQLSARAQAVVDVVVRNLYERTADVGFLSTDADICRFLMEDAGDRELLEARLHEYIRKYTVYDGIFVLDHRGDVAAAIGGASSARLEHALFERALHAQGHVEHFGHSTLLPDRERALLYAHRIECEGRALGVLVLSFRFDNEMAGIFATFRRPRDRAVMLLLDAGGRVIASSDPDHVPLGRSPDNERDASGGGLVEFGGREYIVCTREATGYQGYAGPGWRGQVMVPADTAFRDEKVAGDVPADGSDWALQSGELMAIEAQAGAIKDALNRVVWNGQVMAGGRRGDSLKLKSMLQQISETGERMRAVFSGALATLSDTVHSTTLLDLQFVSRLMMDVMDRNLYERANDCRWWSLAPALRAGLAGGRPDAHMLGRLLDDINRLYTVYDRLFVFDEQGCIVACSNLSGAAERTLGRHVDAALLDAVRRLPDTQSYTVTAFEPTPLHRGEHTYIYCAAVRAPDDDARVVGGIGIVFESGREFRAMLGELLPQREGVWAAFCEPDGRVIASTRADLPPGARLPLGGLAQGLAAGASRHAVDELAGTRHSIGIAASAGYREYKTTGDYRNDVLAVVAMPLPGARSASVSLDELAAAYEVDVREGEGEEFALFRLDDRHLAVTAQRVLEAAEPDRVRCFGSGEGLVAGVLQLDEGVRAEHVPVIHLRAFFDLPLQPGRGHVVVTQCARGRLGLIVDDLLTVAEFGPDNVRPVPDMLTARFRWLERLIITGRDRPLATVLDLDALYDMLRERMRGELIDPALLEQAGHGGAQPPVPSLTPRLASAASGG